MGQSYGGATYGIEEACDDCSELFVADADLNTELTEINAQISKRITDNSNLDTLLNAEIQNRIDADNAEVVARNTAIANALSKIGETKATLLAKLGITTLSGSNSGDETAATIIAKLGYTPASTSAFVPSDCYGKIGAFSFTAGAGTWVIANSFYQRIA